MGKRKNDQVVVKVKVGPSCVLFKKKLRFTKLWWWLNSGSTQSCINTEKKRRVKRRRMGKAKEAAVVAGALAFAWLSNPSLPSRNSAAEDAIVDAGSR